MLATLKYKDLPNTRKKGTEIQVRPLVFPNKFRNTGYKLPQSISGTLNDPNKDKKIRLQSKLPNSSWSYEIKMTKGYKSAEIPERQREIRHLKELRNAGIIGPKYETLSYLKKLKYFKKNNKVFKKLYHLQKLYAKD